MKESNLLKSRIKIIGAYPASPYKIGDIVCLDHNGDFILYSTKELSPIDNQIVDVARLCNIKFIDQYPTLLREAYWWEGISKDDLPEYISIMTPKGNQIVRVYRHNCYGDEIFSYKENNMTEHYSSYKNSFPATALEYNTFINK